MFNDDSGYHLVPGTAVCLPNSMKKRMKGGNKKSDATYERMLALNVSKKGRGEYAKIGRNLWKSSTRKRLSQTKYFMSKTFLCGNNNIIFPYHP